jgi:hypothetical protein
MVLSYNVDDAINMLETFFLDLKGLHVVFEMTIVEAQAQAVEANRVEEGGIFLGEEVLQEAVKEEVVFLAAKHLEQCASNLMLSAGEAIHKIFHEHPSAQRRL